jgi:DNA-binding MarR family transcriptional regulator
VTARRITGPRPGRAAGSASSAAGRPIGLLLSTLAAIYERAFLEGLTAEAPFASITAADHGVLRCLAERSATSVAIARTLGVSKQAVGKTIASLEQRGFVARHPSATDQRAQVVSLTTAGRKLIRRSLRVATTLEAVTEQTLGHEDLALLKDLLVRAQGAKDRLLPD